MEIIAIVIFLAVIALIVTDKMHRTTAALAGAVLLLLTGVLSGPEAIGYIDFNTIGVLIGMMLFVAVVKESGLFEYIAILSAKKVKGDPWKIMVVFTVVTAILSALLDNVTTVLLVGPMAIAIARMLELDPVPYLLMLVLASNVGGTGTLIGDPPNIMIGSAAGLSFTDFLENTGIAVVFIVIAQLLIMRALYKKGLAADSAHIQKVMQLDEKKSVTDPLLMKEGVIVMVLVVLAFIFHDRIGIPTAGIALTAGALIMVLSRKSADKIVPEVEWTTLLFFMSLFVLVGGLQKTGVIGKLAELVINSVSGHQIILMMVILWASALFSSVLDNIPFVATLIPMLLEMADQGIDVTPLWWAISLGACLGGNGTLIGASANVVIAGIANQHGYSISFARFTKVGFPIMIVSILISSAFLLLKYGL